MADQGNMYKLNLNRNKTKKWQEAKQVNYGGDDWGEDEYDEYEADPPPVPALPPGPTTYNGPSSRAPQPLHPSQRGFTNAPQSVSSSRLSFDKEDDRRQLSGGRDHSYVASTAAPHQQTLDASQTALRQHPSLQVETHALPSNVRPSRPYEQVASPPAAGDKSYPSRVYPPISADSELDEATRGTETARIPDATKPLPFIRPADIYKRMEEEREKERRSQDSTRPSFDAVAGNPAADDPKQPVTAASQPTQSPLNPVSQTGPSEVRSPAGISQDDDEVQVSRQASSVYSNRRDPLSASSTTSTQFPMPPLREVATPHSSHMSSADQDPVLAPGYRPSEHTSTYRHNEVQLDPGSGKPTSPRAFGAYSIPSAARGLEHQPSLGYTSVVHKAFDIEAHDSPSPSTTTETLPRSNSASTSAISPILERSTDSAAQDPRWDELQEADIPEPLSGLKGRPESTSTIKPEQTSSQTTPIEPVVVPGFRRNSATPSPSNSPARHPQNTTAMPAPQAEHGYISDMSRLSPGDDVGVGDHSALLSDPHTAARSPSRTASEDYHEWKEHRRSFHAKHGLDDDSNASPVTSTPVSRAATPSKNATSQADAQFQPRSGRSTPASTSGQGLLQPGPQLLQADRQQGSRPSIPGGWQSDLTISSGYGQPESDPHMAATRPSIAGAVNESTESIPTAKAPRNWPSGSVSLVDQAFAAAAAAGTAMAGSFSGSTLTKRVPESSESDTEDETRPDQNSSLPIRHSVARDFANEDVEALDQQTVNPQGRSTLHSVERTPSPSDFPSTATTTLPETTSTESTSVDYPAPLRMSKLHETIPTSARPSVINPTAFPGDEDPEQLQHDIVESLTPSTTRPRSPEPVSGVGLSRSTTGQRVDSYDAGLSDEYSSYWQNDATDPAPSTVHEQVTSDELSGTTDQRPPPIVPAVPSEHASSNVDLRGRPDLDQRFSWEASKDATKARHPEGKQPSLSHEKSSVTESNPDASLDHTAQPAPVNVDTTFDAFVKHSFESQDDVTRSAAIPPQSQPQLQPPPTGPPAKIPTEKVDFQSILSYNDQHRRIAAFDDNRRLYSEPNGLLEHWLASLNIPEHADIFASNRQVRTQPATPQPAPPTPRRDISLPSGTRQIQEDGKRILAAAGKYGGKAGSAAKGLFAKGKDKFRTASASDKAPPNSQVRLDNNDLGSPSRPSLQQSALPLNAPQLPTPTLSTPVEEVSWSLISSTIDQIFNDSSSPHPGTNSVYGQRFSQLGIQGDVTRNNNDGAYRGTATDASPRSPSGGLKTTGPDQGSQQQQTAGAGMVPHQPEARATEERARKDQTGLPDHSEPVIVTSKPMTALPSGKMEISTNQTRPPPVNHQRSQSLISEMPQLGQRTKSRMSDTVSAATSGAPPSLEDQNVSRTMSRSQEVPIFLSHSLSKEAEARQEAEAAANASGQGTLPPYSSPIDKTAPKIVPGTQIVPIVDLKSPKVSSRQISERPFSFMGTETMSSVPSYHPGGSPPPVSPGEGQPRKSQTGKNLTEPDITQHPAYRRESDDAVPSQDQTQNPLPSSRRPQGEVDEARRRSKQPTPVQEAPGYRIPGPYVAEFRSPRPKGSADQIQNSITQRSNNETTSVVQEEHPTNQAIPPPPVRVEEPPQSQPANGFHVAQTPVSEPRFVHQPRDDPRVEPHTRIELNRPADTDRARNRPFASYFRHRTDSRNREDNVDSPNVTDGFQEDKKKKKGIFRMNNRTESPSTPLSGLPEAGPGHTGLNENGHRRKLSTDLLKPKTAGLRSAEGKKKRTSGLAGLFSRAIKEKGRSPASTSQRPEFDTSHQTQNFQPPGHYASHSSSSSAYPGATARTEQYHQYGHMPSAEHRPVLGPSTFQPSQSNYDAHRGRLPNGRTDHLDVGSDHLWADKGNTEQYQANGVGPGSGATPYTTTSTMPAAAGSTILTSYSVSPPVPVTRAIRDISYRADHYTPPTNSPPQGMADHVKNLNKRSRSPRLGKPPSDEYLTNSYSAVPGALDIPDPARQLGTFSSKKASPVGIPRSNEEQEKPWTLTLPGGQEEEAENRDKAGNIEPESEQRARHASVQQIPGSATLAGAVTASDALNRVTGTNASRISIAPLEGSTVTQGEVYQTSSSRITSSRDSQQPLGPPRQQTPSPSPATTVPMDRRHPQRSKDNQGPFRNALASTAPPSTLRNYSNHGAELTKLRTTPITTATTGDTITTAVRTSNGSHGPVTNMDTSINTSNSREAFTPVDRPPSAAPNRFSQVRSTTPQQSGRAPTPLQHHRLSERGSEQSPIQPSTSRNATTQLRSPSPQKLKSFPSPDPDHAAPHRMSQNILNGGRQSQDGQQGSSYAPRPVSPLPPRRTSKTLTTSNEVHPSKIFAPVELPGSKPDGYESEDEPVMSATFFPGQDWQPTFEGGWED